MVTREEVTMMLQRDEGSHAWRHGVSDSDMVKMLDKLGLKVAEPASRDPAASFTYCMLQWFMRQKWILRSLGEEEQEKIVAYVKRNASIHRPGILDVTYAFHQIVRSVHRAA
eukprot:7322313-Karenia_brevis.AAC.1